MYYFAATDGLTRMRRVMTKNNHHCEAQPKQNAEKVDKPVVFFLFSFAAAVGMIIIILWACFWRKYGADNMAMMRKTITIPDAMEGWIKAQIESGRYGNDSEYFRDLIRRDQERRLAERELALLIQEGLESGVSAASVPDIMRRVEDRLQKHGVLSAYE